MIGTVAGNGSSGVGVPATSSQISPGALAFDTVGNLYFTSSGRIRKMTPAGIISNVAGNGTKGFSGDGGLATLAQLDNPASVAVDSVGNLYIADSYNNRIRKVTMEPGVSMNLTSGSSATFSTEGLKETTQSGYATLMVNSGTTPYGTAVFSFKQNGIMVSEAGAPASPPTTSARAFIEYRSGVLSIPGRPNSGRVDINTGIGIVNLGDNLAHISYTLFGADGATLAMGQGTLAAGNHFAKFINQLNEVAPDFGG
jgi:hypothetical protein